MYPIKLKWLESFDDHIEYIPPPLIKLEDSKVLKSLNFELTKIVNEMINNNVNSIEVDFRKLFKDFTEENLDINSDFFFYDFLRKFVISTKKFLTITLSDKTEFFENCENDLYIFNYKNYKGTRNYTIILQEIKKLGILNVSKNDINVISVLKYLLLLIKKINMIMNDNKNSFNDKLGKDFLLEYIKYDNYNDFSKEFNGEFNSLSISNVTLFSLIFSLREYENEFQNFIIKNIIWSNLQEFIKMNIYEETYLNIIFEDLYEIKVLMPLINYISQSLKNNKNIILNVDLIKKYCNNWNKIKDIKENKISYCFSYSENNYLNIFSNLKTLTLNDKIRIKEEGNGALGFVLENFEGLQNNESIFAINHESLDDVQVIYHELIHYLQWASGHSIIRLASKRKNKIFNDISNEDKDEISKVLNINQDYFDQLYHSMLNEYEIIPHVSNLFNELEEIFKKDLKKNIKLLIRSFEIKNRYNNFKDYFKNVLIKLKKYNLLVAFNNISLISKLFLVFTFYFKISVNTFKNHLFGYVNK